MRVELKRVAVALSLMFATAPACAEWVNVGRTNTAVHYVDPDTVRKDGHLRMVWALQDLVEEREDGTRSIRALQQYDCSQDRFRYLSVASHSRPMAGGQVLQEYALRDAWSPRTIGRYYYAVGKIACER